MTLDVALDALNVERQRTEALQLRIAQLTDQMQEMQRDGFKPPAPIPTTPEAPLLPVTVQRAIQERAFTAEIRRQLEAFAYQQIQAGEEPGVVADFILAGYSAVGEGA